MPSLHPDRLPPVDPGKRALARRRNETVYDRPFPSPHRLDREEAVQAAAKPVSVDSRKVFEL
ncbi:hypothetical protein [Streptomyces sp. SID3343]|uniref:hypothetical protein n=1 Tax=Streptomyces sp. SID3343 TaxID=2690260 RepID=UPI00136FC79A|nr:hypothetical protein [Streptomyces sp. SID3343]